MGEMVTRLTFCLYSFPDEASKRPTFLNKILVETFDKPYVSLRIYIYTLLPRISNFFTTAHTLNARYKAVASRNPARGFTDNFFFSKLDQKVMEADRLCKS